MSMSEDVFTDIYLSVHMCLHMCVCMCVLYVCVCVCVCIGFPGVSEVKPSACSARDLGSILGLGRSPGEENGNPLQYSCLENPMHEEAWWATVHGVRKSRTRLSDLTHSLIYVYICVYIYYTIISIGRAGYIIYKDQYKIKMGGPLLKKY